MASSTITISSSSNLNLQHVTRDHPSDGVDRLSKQNTRILEKIFGYLCPQNSVAELPEIFPKEYGAKEKEAQEEELNPLSSRLLAGGVAAIRYRVLSSGFKKTFDDKWCKTWSSGVMSAMPSPLPMNYDIMQQMVARKCVTLFQAYILVHPETLGEKTDGRSFLRTAVINKADPAFINLFLHVIQKKKLWEVLFEDLNPERKVFKDLSPIVDWQKTNIEIVKFKWHLSHESLEESIEILNKIKQDIETSRRYEPYGLEGVKRDIQVYENQKAINEFMRRAPFKVRCKYFGVRHLPKIMMIAMSILSPVLLSLLLIFIHTVLIPAAYVGKIFKHIDQERMTITTRKVCSVILGFIFSPMITPPILLIRSCIFAREKILDRARLNSTIKKILMIPLGIIMFPIVFSYVAVRLVEEDLSTFQSSLYS